MLAAPNDKAFNALPAGTLENLLCEENQDALQELLLNHVVSPALFAEDLVDMDSVESLSGNSLSLEVRGDSLFVGGAEVIRADRAVSNGVFHKIDQVLVPANFVVPSCGGETTEEPTEEATEEPTEEATEEPTAEALDNLFKNIKDRPVFETLFAALKAADLKSAIKKTQGITVFGTLACFCLACMLNCACMLSSWCHYLT